jgi:hypothetical protein
MDDPNTNGYVKSGQFDNWMQNFLAQSSKKLDNSAFSYDSLNPRINTIDMNGVSGNSVTNYASPSQPVQKSAFIENLYKPELGVQNTGNGVPNPTSTAGTDTATPWYQDSDAMQGYAGLASSLMQAAALPGQIKLASLQRKGLEQNIAQAKSDSALNKVAQGNLNANMFNNKPATGMG